MACWVRVRVDACESREKSNINLLKGLTTNRIENKKKLPGNRK